MAGRLAIGYGRVVKERDRLADELRRANEAISVLQRMVLFATAQSVRMEERLRQVEKTED